MFLSYSDALISNCDISGNRARGDAGGLYISCCNPIIEYCTIANDTARHTYGGTYFGGAMYIHGTANPEIRNCTISGSFSTAAGGAIFVHAAANPVIVNTIIEGTVQGGAIHITASPNASFTYMDFYNNSGGNFTGLPRPGMGVLCAVNQNGDSCDMYMNIYLNPQFVDPVIGDYHLQANSPCIDAGDPARPLDPDSTIADIGALYFDQSSSPPLVVTLTPHNPPILIPASGGNFTFDASIVNTTQSPIIFDAWTEAVLPRGNVYGPIILRTNLQIPAGATIMRVLTQNVPGNAPGGNYTFVGNAGTHPGTVIDSDEFPFTKISGDDFTSFNQSWTCWGWEDRSESDFAAYPAECELTGIYPNPFNPETSINFFLPKAAVVKMEVYNVESRLVSTLIDGWLDSGQHQVVFNGADLPSGVYFCAFQANGYNRSVKIVLVK